MSINSNYISLQGRVYLGKRDANGNPTEMRSVGNVPALSLDLKTDVIDHYDSQSGQRAVDLRLVKNKNAAINMTLEEFTNANAALALHGTYNPVTGATVTTETVSTPLPTLGDRYFLAHQKVSNLVLTDSTGTPVTLVKGTHYTVDEDFGAITFLNVATLTAPIKAAYTYGAVTDIGIFTAPIPERFLRLEGINTADSNSPILVELYRVAFNPLKNFGFITDDINKMELDGILLADSTKAYDATLGQYGRITLIG